MTSIVYTSIIGNRDVLIPQPDTGDEFIAFLDFSWIMNPWHVVRIERQFASNVLEAKRYKLLPHVALPPHEYSLWIDGTIETIKPQRLEDMAHRYLSDADIAMFAHRTRTCVYEEGWECIRRQLDDRDTIYALMARYTQEGYPANHGLHEATVILRRNTPQMQYFNEAWWQEVQNGSTRDQLSFNYLAHKHGLKIASLPGDLSSGGNALFVRGQHVTLTSRIHLSITTND